MHQYRQQYLDYLAEIVNYGEGDRPRVRHPAKWGRIKAITKSGAFINLGDTDKKIWIWSDHHFSHRRVIEMENRPFANHAEMHKYFVDAYNETVAPGDIVIWAGDITFGSTSEFHETIWKHFSKTYNILVVGNHDFKKKNLRKLDFDEQHLLLAFKLGSKSVVITHYPFECKDEDVIVVHGHLHGRPSPLASQRNISVESIGYKPVLLADVL